MKSTNDCGATSFGVRGPEGSREWEDLTDLRWRLLRAPWGQPRGSERDERDATSVHRVAVSAAGRIVGTGRLHFNSAEEAQVRFMAVEEEFQGRGVGAAILHELEREARRLGARWIVLNAREAAVPFYQRHGYRQVGASPTLFGAVPHRALRKDLDSAPACPPGERP